jgi:hypothetical protein
MYYLLFVYLWFVGLGTAMSIRDGVRYGFNLYSFVCPLLWPFFISLICVDYIRYGFLKGDVYEE